MTQLGADVTAVRTSAQGPGPYSVGQRFRTTESGVTKEYVYCQDTGAAITGAGYFGLFTVTHTVIMATVTVTTPGTGFGRSGGPAMAAIAASGYGWIQVLGPATVRTLASAAAYTRLNTTATAGCLDDDGGVGSEQVFGVVVGTATGGAEANNTTAILNYPHASLTL